MKESKKSAFTDETLAAATERKFNAIRDIMTDDMSALDQTADNADLFLLALASSQAALADIVIGNIQSLANAKIIDSDSEAIVLKGAKLLNRVLAAAVYDGIDSAGDDDESSDENSD